MTSLNAIYSVEIPPTPLDKGGGDSREDPPKALTPTKCVSPAAIKHVDHRAVAADLHLGALATRSNSQDD